MVSTASAPRGISLSANIRLITDASSEQSVQDLTSKLELDLSGSGATASALNLTDTQHADLRDNVCVVLLEVSKPVFHNIDDATFKLVRDMVLQSQAIVWVTKGCSQGEAPLINLFAGLSRAVRSENPRISFATIDIDPSSPSDCGLNIQIISKILATLHGAEDGTILDWEFSVRNGSVFIPKLLPDKGINDMLSSRDWKQTPVLSQLKQPDRHLKLVFDSARPLDHIYLFEDLVSENDVLQDEIELEVKAAGFQNEGVKAAMMHTEDGMMFECSGIVTRGE